MKEMQKKIFARKKFLFVADANFLAHMSRALEIAKILQSQGHEIVMAGDGEFLFLAKEEGIKTDVVFTIPKERTLELIKKGGIAKYGWLKETFSKSVEADIDCIKRHSPDLVVGDLHLTLSVSCRLLKVPYVSIVNAHWTNYMSSKVSALDGHFSTKLLGERLAEKIFPTLKNWCGAYWTLPFRKFKKEKGLVTEYKNLFEAFEGDLTLLPDLPQFSPTHKLPQTIKYIGPVIWQPKMKEPEWLETLEDNKPIIYFTLGSSGDPRIFNDAIKAFGDSDFQVIITTGGLPFKVDYMPKNIFVTDFAPGLKIMEKSTVVVSHGGNGTIYQAITAGRPVLGIPSHIDQDFNLQRVRDLGFGIKLPKNATPENIVCSVNEILSNPHYQENAIKLREEIKYFNGPQRAVELILDFLATSNEVKELRL